MRNLLGVNYDCSYCCRSNYCLEQERKRLEYLRRQAMEYETRVYYFKDIPYTGANAMLGFILAGLFITFFTALAVVVSG